MSNLQNFVTLPALSAYDNPFSEIGLDEFRRTLERRVDFAGVGVQPENSYPMLLVATGRMTTPAGWGASPRRGTGMGRRSLCDWEPGKIA